MNNLTLYDVSLHFAYWWGNPGDRVRFSFLGGAATPRGRKKAGGGNLKRTQTQKTGQEIPVRFIFWDLF